MSWTPRVRTTLRTRRQSRTATGVARGFKVARGALQATAETVEEVASRQIRRPLSCAEDDRDQRDHPVVRAEELLQVEGEGRAEDALPKVKEEGCGEHAAWRPAWRRALYWIVPVLACNRFHLALISGLSGTIRAVALCRQVQYPGPLSSSCRDARIRRRRSSSLRRAVRVVIWCVV